MKIFIVRHGQDEDNVQGILNGHRDKSLTDLGRSQAQAIGQKLKDKGIKHIYSSPLKRTFQTASIIADIIGISDITKHDDLIERDFGFFTGKPVADIKKHTDDVFEGDRVTYFLEEDRTEGFPKLIERAKKVYGFITDKHKDENILLVTHSDIGKMIQAVHKNWTWQQGLDTPYLDNTGILELEI